MSKKNNGWKKFLAGAAVGAGLGILFAPKKGSETRQELKCSFDAFMIKVKDLDKEEVKAELESRLYDLKDALEQLDQETVLKAAKKQAKKLQDMASEFASYAVEKGTPVLEEAANKVKEVCIDTANKVVEKLENKESK